MQPLIVAHDEHPYFRGVLGTSPVPASSPIRRIMLVGAKIQSSNDRRLSDRDRGHLYHAFSSAVACGVPVDPEFDLDIVNIHPDHGGRNFFDEIKPVDMVVVCFVYNPPIEMASSLATPQQRDRYIDDRHFMRNIWHDSAVRVGARVVSTVIGPMSHYFQDNLSEINHRHFLRADNSQFVRMDNYDGTSNVTTMRRVDYMPR